MWKGNKFEEDFTLKGQLIGMHENRKALLIFKMIGEILEENKELCITSIEGRINLYCKLLIRAFGKESIKAKLESSEGLAEDGKRFHSANSLNLILPESVPELNLRLRFLYGAATKIHTCASEGGKRQTVALWNDLNRNIQKEPIRSFFAIQTHEKLTHRITPDNPEDDAADYIASLQKLSDKYYKRSGFPIKSHLYACNENCSGLTKKIVALIENESSLEALRNQQVQVKYINDYLAKICRNLSLKENILKPVIVAEENENCIMADDSDEEESEEQEEKKEKVVKEKNILDWHWCSQRLFVEVMAEFALKRDENPKIFEMYLPFDQRLKTSLQNFLDKKDGSLHPKQKEKETMTNSPEDRLNAMRGFVNEDLSKRNEIQYNLNFFADPCLCAKTMPVPPDLEVKKCSDPKSLEFFYAFWTFRRSKGMGDFPLTIGTSWKPLDYCLLFTTFAASVYDQQTCQNFAAMIENNGKKETKKYKGNYAHDNFAADST